MWPENYDSEKAAFLKAWAADSAETPAPDPVFEYTHEIEQQTLERFPVCKLHASEAKALLDSVVKEFGSDTAFHQHVTRKRKAQGEAKVRQAGGETQPWNTPMTPEELVASAERFLRDCLATAAAAKPVLYAAATAEPEWKRGGESSGSTGLWRACRCTSRSGTRVGRCLSVGPS
jgi:hypothetical protein